VRPTIAKEDVMSVAKVTEISASSNTSFEDAIQKGIDRADKTLDKVKGAWISEMKVDVEDGKVTAYRVNMKVTFVLKG
jgi:flavin-binding protein dodecin